MTLAQILKQAEVTLASHGIDSARLDALILLEDILGRDRAWLLAHPETDLSADQLNRLNKQIDRRTRHEPLAYIRGFSEFYGRKFRINKRVLEPRPESEAIIDQLKNLSPAKNAAIADIGTGSGCLGITAALELHTSQIDLYDIDSGALAVAKHNLQLHELNLALRKRDLLNRPIRQYDIILANLPYIPDSWTINQAAQAEPKLAIYGGKDGLRLYARLFEQLAKLGWQSVTVLTESLPPKHEGLTQIAKTHGFSQLAEQDFVQVFGN